MKNYHFENMVAKISNSWIIGCSLLSCGIMTCAYIDGLSKHPIIHMKRKYNLELQQINNNSILLDEEIKNEEKYISYYWKYINSVYMIGIAGVFLVALRKTRIIRE